MQTAPQRKVVHESSEPSGAATGSIACIARLLWGAIAASFNGAQRAAADGPRQAGVRPPRRASPAARAPVPGAASEAADTHAANEADDAEAEAESFDGLPYEEEGEEDLSSAEAASPRSRGTAAATRGAAPQSSLAAYASAVRAIEPVDAQEEIRLATLAQAGDARARQRLIESHLGVVIAVARGYTRPCMPLEDMIEEGNFGLMHAVDRFDVARGVRFASYARWWIRDAINNAMTTQSRAVRLPSHVVRGISSITKAQRELQLRAHNAPARPAGSMGAAQAHRAGLGEVATATGRPTASVAQLIALSQPALSLNASVEGGSDTAMQDELVAEGAHEPDAALLSKEVLATVLNLIDRLPASERTVIVQRFGFGSCEPRTLEEVGDALHLTAERARQLQVQAIARLREMLASRGIDASQFL
jgi:RNA polymerase nonessential primary-like sigma factor